LARSDLERGYERSRQRNDAVRAGLTPLAPGERPLALTLSALLAALIAAGNLAAVIAGVEVDGARPVAGAVVLALVMGGVAVGLWQRRYLVVLLWQALLAAALVYASLSVMLASNLAAVVLCVAVLAIAGPLFWLNVRIMARLQTPPG
jgi:small-conductance mechanosensitive channel